MIRNDPKLQINELREAVNRWANSKLWPVQSFYDRQGRSIERWITSDLTNFFCAEWPNEKVCFEEPWQNTPKKRCDLTIRRNGIKFWVEVAHVWSWTQSKWKQKCKTDIQRIKEGINVGQEDQGIFLLFLLSRPSWWDKEFEKWIQNNLDGDSIIIIDKKSRTQI